MVLAVATGSAPLVVGASVDPNKETINLIPAAVYCDLTVVRWEADNEVHSAA